MRPRLQLKAAAFSKRVAVVARSSRDMLDTLDSGLSSCLSWIRY